MDQTVSYWGHGVNDRDNAFDDRDRAVRFSSNGLSYRGRERGSADELELGEATPGDARVLGEPGAASLGYIRAALMRKARFWCALAVVGLVLGIGYMVARPAAYKASTTILIANPPGAQPGTAVGDDIGLVESRTVAGKALVLLGLQESPDALVSQYTATALTNQILEITVKAPSGGEAIREANALASAFLSFQANLLQAQGQLIDAALQQQIAKAETTLNALNEQVRQASAQSSSAVQQSELTTLRGNQNRASNQLTALKQAVYSNQASNKVAIATSLKGSQVLDHAVATRPSRKKELMLYGGGGLLAGLVIGIAIVVIGAVTSDRLRRRDDVARALRAPVKLSVGNVVAATRKPWSVSAQDMAVRKIVTHLQNAICPSSRCPATLAVVPIDDTRLPALCLVSLAASSARRGLRVVIADLCDGSPAARMLGVAEPGLHGVTTEQGVQLMVAIPDRDDVIPVGPLSTSSRQEGRGGRLAGGCRSADLLLTLSSLDPAIGADHLPGWAGSVVVTVTAGRSSGERVYAAGEMVRLSGIHAMSGVLFGADKDDESLGIRVGQDPQFQPAAIQVE